MTIQNIKPLYLFLSESVAALRNCEAKGFAYAGTWRDRIEQAARDCLPSGSGFDSGCAVDLDGSRADRITIETAFHHMNANGFYDGWTQHKIHLTPAFGGFDMRVTGRDRNGIKEYIAETVGAALETRVGYSGTDGPADGFRVVYAPEIDRAQAGESI